MHMPLTKGSIVPILFTVLGGMVLITAVSYFYTKRSMERIASGQILQTARFMDQEVSEHVREILTNVTLWTEEEVFRLALTDSYLGRSARVAANKRLAERLSYGRYNSLTLVNPDGEAVAASAQSQFQSGSHVDQEYFQCAMSGEMCVLTVVRDRFTGLPALVIAGPVRDQDGRIAGALVASLDIELFAMGMLDSARIGQSGGAHLIDSSNRHLTHLGRASTSLNTDEAVSARLRQAAGREIVRYLESGRERMATGLVNVETGWLLAVSADTMELMRPAARLAALNGTITLCILILMGVVIFVLRQTVINLRSSEARYRTLAATIPVGVLTLDHQGKPTYANTRAADILGLDPDRLPGTDWTGGFETKEGQPLAMSELPMGAVLDGKTRQAGKVVWYRGSNGERRVLSVNVSHLGGEADGGVVAAFEDVTDRSRVQEMMIQTEKMLSIGGLAAGMAHEINNPLASILQSLQVVTRRLDPANAANQKHALTAGLNLDAMQAYMRLRELDQFLADIHEAGVRASKIVVNMLGFARKSGGEFAPCDLGELLDKTLELAGGDYDLKRQYDFKHIRINRDYEQGLPQVECQRLEMEQVFFNLVKNAAQAFKENPPCGQSPAITVRTCRAGDCQGVRVEVEDNGPGMSEEAARRAFEPFYTTKGVGEGTGLGLSVAYFIVTENHKGSMTVESNPGKGARFVIILPLTPPV